MLLSGRRPQSWAQGILGVVKAMLRWAGTSASRVIALASHARWIVLSMVLTAVGVAEVFLSVPAEVNITLAVVSMTLLVIELREYLRQRRELDFVQRHDGYQDVLTGLAGSERFQVISATEGHIIFDQVASSGIANGRVCATVAKDPYRPGRELGEVEAAYMRHRLGSRGSTFNGHVLGLGTNLGSGSRLETDQWQLVHGRYWDHLRSDIFALTDPRRDGVLLPGYGRSLFVNRHGRLRDFADCWLLNAIGASVLTITTDGRLVVAVQSNMNESSQGLLAPSGSGSLEPADMRDALTLDVATLVCNGALRELTEETGIPPTSVSETAFLGFGRWLEKAAKPEFVSVARLDIDSHAVKRCRIPAPDAPYTRNVELWPLAPLSEWNPADPVSAVEASDSRLLSVPLSFGLNLLIMAAEDPNSAVGGLLERSGAPV
jgi:hypothetical protein